MGNILGVAKKIANKDCSCEQVVRHALANVTTDALGLNAVVETFDDIALETAKKWDQHIANGTAPAYAGVPFLIKDNMCLEGAHVTCCSAILTGYKSPYTSTAISRAMDAGFIPIGRTNMDEFAMGSSNEHSVYGPVSNPWNTDYVPGGSSGGSAAAVAAGMVPVTLGSDTGGSIRQPAAYCGVVGMKPTYGTVSRYGLVAFASSLDQIGPFGQSVDDVAIMLEAICGQDPNDATSEKLAVNAFSQHVSMDALSGKRIGVANQLMSDYVDADIRSAVEVVMKKMVDLGATVDFYDFPYIEEALATYYILAPAEASSNLSRFDGVRYGMRHMNADSLGDMIKKTRQHGFGDEVKRRIILGTYVLSSGYYDAYYAKAQSVRAVVTEAYAKLFREFDVLCSPTAPSTAFLKGRHVDDPMTMYLSDIATIPVNLAGLPALSMPCSLSSQGLPIGLQLTGAWFKDHDLLNVATVLEDVLGFTQRYPFSVPEENHAI